MNDPLAPISACRLPGTTLRLYVRHFLEFVALSILGAVVVFAFRLRYGGGTTALLDLHFSTAAPAVLAALAGFAIAIVGVVVSSAATVEAVRAARSGRSVQVAAGYRALRKRFWKIAGVLARVFVRALLGIVCSLGISILVLGAAAALGLNSRVVAGNIGYGCAGFFLISATLWTIWIFARYSVAVQDCVIEGISSKQAMKRSAELTSGKLGRILLVQFGFLVLFVVVDFLVGAPALWLPVHSAASQITCAIAGFFALALASPYATIAMSLVYYERADLSWVS